MRGSARYTLLQPAVVKARSVGVNFTDRALPPTTA